MTNAQLDEIVFEVVKGEPGCSFSMILDCVRKRQGHVGQETGMYRAVDRSLQRLRRKGVLTYRVGKGWRIFQ